LSLFVSNDGELQVAAADLVDVFDPSAVALNRVCRQADELHAAFSELGLEFGKGTQFSRAHGGVIFRVGEKDDPVVPDEFVEVDVALRRIGVEIGCNAAQAQSEHALAVCRVNGKDIGRSALTEEDVRRWSSS
jgi:hypothetical protein